MWCLEVSGDTKRSIDTSGHLDASGVPRFLDLSFPLVMNSIVVVLFEFNYLTEFVHFCKGLRTMQLHYGKTWSSKEKSCRGDFADRFCLSIFTVCYSVKFL